jgi:hypothetical protein
MLDALKQAERYHELAEGCRRLAAFSFSTQMQDHYFQMAEHYTALAETEEHARPLRLNSDAPEQAWDAEMEHRTARDTTTGPPKPLGACGATVPDRVGAAQH